MKRLSSILAIFLVVSAVAVVAISAGAQDNGNSTIPNDITIIVEPTPDTSASDLSDGNDDTVHVDVANDTNVTVTPKPINNVTVTPKTINNVTVTPKPINNVTVTPKPNNHVTVTPKPNSNATVTPEPNSNVTVTPKPNSNVTNVTVIPKTTTGKIIPAPTSIKTDITITQAKEAGKVAALRPINNEEVKYANTNNDGVQITALHPLSGGVEYVSITNFNDFTAHLEGYKIHEMQCNNTIVFQDIKIKPGHTLKVYTGSHPDGPDVVGTHKLHHIYNQHDTVELICACENVISSYEK